MATKLHTPGGGGSSNGTLWNWVHTDVAPRIAIVILSLELIFRDGFLPRILLGFVSNPGKTPS